MDYIPFYELDIERVNIDEIRKNENKSDNNFMHYSVELMKELGQYYVIIASIVNNNSQFGGWNRDQAVLVGLLVRLSKLIVSYIENICKKQLEIANIIQRCILETAINLEYLIQNFDNNIIDEFVKYSLKTEKALLNTINDNINKRGAQENIEVRMLESIERAFNISKVNAVDIDPNDRKVWGKSIFNRFKELGYVELYNHFYGLQSHFVHGNWQEVLSYHLTYENDEFFPKTEWNIPRPQMITPLCFLLCNTLFKYLDLVFKDFLEAPEVNLLIEKIA